MSVIDYTKEISESASTLEHRLKTLVKAKLRNRCEVLIWLKSGKVSSMRQAMILRNMNKSQGGELRKQCKSEGLEGFLHLKCKGRTSALDGNPAFWKRLGAEGFADVKEVRAWLAKTQGLKYAPSGLYDYFSRKGIKLKTGRPHHPKRDGGKACGL